MARIVFITLLLCTSLGFANPKIVTALVHSDQTYIIDSKGQSLQEFSIGDTIYLVIDGSEKKKGFMRVTFDPTNMQGHGWVEEQKVRVLSQYRSADGKLPKEYERKYEVAQKPVQQDFSQDLLSGELTFIEELINKEQDTLSDSWSKPREAPVQSAKPLAPGEKNPFEEDLEFLFTEDAVFGQTFETAKNEHFSQGVRNVGISHFSLQGDQFAKTLKAKFKEQLNQEMQFNKVEDIAHLDNIETVAKVSSVSISNDLSGVFFGILSPKVGQNRLFKIKYYDRALKQFVFEKVVNIPLDQSIDPSVQKLVNEAALFLRSQ